MPYRSHESYQAWWAYFQTQLAYFLFICFMLYGKDLVPLTLSSTNKLCWRNNMIYMRAQGIKVGHAGMVTNLYPVNIWMSTLDLNILILCLISLLWEKEESGNYFQFITEFITLQSQSQSVWTRRNWVRLSFHLLLIIQHMNVIISIHINI